MQKVTHDHNSRSRLRVLAWLFAVALLAPGWATAQEKPPLRGTPRRLEV